MCALCLYQANAFDIWSAFTQTSSDAAKMLYLQTAVAQQSTQMFSYICLNTTSKFLRR